MGKPVLSIIIPCKNEERNLPRCLCSVFQAIKNIQGVEVVVVDAASQDKTVEVALQFPAGVIQLDQSWVHTAAAGRYLGCLNTQGKYIFIVDADIELIAGFLEQAVHFMDRNPGVGAVAGLGRQVYWEDGQKVGHAENIYKRDPEKIAAVEYLGAAALFRRTALEEAGHFNPYLYSQEELELGQRMSTAGWELVSLPLPMAIHHTYPPKGMVLFRKQLQANRFTGVGQILRLSLQSGFFWVNFWRFKKFIVCTALAALMAVATVMFLFGKDVRILSVATLVVCIMYLYLAVRKHSFKQAACSAGKWLWVVAQVGKGFLAKPKPFQNYPRDVKVIKKSI